MTKEKRQRAKYTTGATDLEKITVDKQQEIDLMIM